MARCILHIGWHKTGTTAIQQTALKNRATLAEFGVHYPSWHHNHGALLVSAVRCDKLIYYAEQFLTPPKGVGKMTHKEVGRQRIEGAARDAGDGTLLLSGEDLTLLTGDEIDKLISLLAPHFSEIRAVAYIRHHADYASSAAQQMVKMGFALGQVLDWIKGSGELRDRLKVMTPLPHYGERLSAWAKSLGPENIDLFSFDALRRKNPDIRPQFFRRVLPDEAAVKIGADPAPISNLSLDSKAVHLLDRMNRLQPLFHADGRANSELAVFAQSFFHDLGTEAFKLPVSVHKFVLAEAVKDQEALASLFPEAAAALAHPGEDDFMPLDRWLVLDRFAQAQGALGILLKTARGEQDQRARAAFFGALASHQYEPDTALLDERMRNALFLMNDGLLLKSCGGWLARYRLDEYAALYFKKAVTYLPKDAVLRSLLRKSVAAAEGPA